MGDELKFQQRWEFRRRDNDLDSSSDDDSKSGSSSEPVLKKLKLVSSLSSLDNKENGDTIRLQQEDNDNHGIGIKFATSRQRKTRKKKNQKEKNKQLDKNNLVNNKIRRDSHKEVNKKKKKSNSCAYKPEALDDLRNFMESLLDDLKAARENLLVWMREEMHKLVADDIGSWPEKREVSHGGEKRRGGSYPGDGVQLQDKKTFEEIIQVQHQNNCDENVRVLHQNISKDGVQVQHQSNFEETIYVRQQNNLGVTTKVQHRNNFAENIQVQHQSNFESGMRAQNCNGGSLGRLVKSSKAAEFNNYYQALENRVDYGQVMGSTTSTGKEKGERLGLSVKSNSQFSPSNQNAQVLHEKSVVLGIRAQNCNGRSSERSVKGKTTTASNKRYQVPEDRIDYGQAVGSMISTEKDKGGRLGSSVELKFSSNPSGELPSSTYLTLPTVLSEPHVENHRLDTSTSNYIQPRVAGNKTGVNSEIANQLLNSSAHCGYFPGIQAEERIGNLAHTGSRMMGCFDQNSTPRSSSSAGSGFPVPLYQGMDEKFSIPGQVYLGNLPRENSNKLGLTLNGESIRFSGGSYVFSEHNLSNNFLSHSNYKADGRFMACQIPNIKDARLFPK